MRREDVRRVLGSLEAEVMEVLWASPEALTVRDVLSALNTGRTPELAYTTVMTVLSRLADKDVLARRPAGRGYVYEAVVPDAAAIAVRGVLRNFGDAAVAQFVDQARADPKILKRLERLLSDEASPKRAGGPG